MQKKKNKSEWNSRLIIHKISGEEKICIHSRLVSDDMISDLLALNWNPIMGLRFFC